MPTIISRYLRRREEQRRTDREVRELQRQQQVTRYYEEEINRLNEQIIQQQQAMRVSQLHVPYASYVDEDTPIQIDYQALRTALVNTSIFGSSNPTWYFNQSIEEVKKPKKRNLPDWW